jgi:hypothetical protein
VPGCAAPTSVSESIEHDLEALIDGLLFPSESDRPLNLVVWPADQVFSVKALLAHEGYALDSLVELREVQRFFRPAVTVYEDDPRQEAMAQRFRTLLAFMEQNLRDLQAIAVGRIAIDVFVLGSTPEGRIIGFRTVVVET